MPVMVKCHNCQSLNKAFVQMSKEELNSPNQRNKIIQGVWQNCGNCHEMIHLENADLEWTK